MKSSPLPHPTLDRYIVAARDAARQRIQSERAGANYEASRLDAIWSDNVFYRLFTGITSFDEYGVEVKAAFVKASELYTEFQQERTRPISELGNSQ